MKRLAFIDSGVLIAASRGTGEVASKAFEAINDPDVEFASSIFVKLETMPKALYFKRKDEAEFYETFFKSVSVWIESSQTLAQSALDEASTNGLGAVDALHVTAAAQCKADEFITAEKAKSALSRVSSVSVRFIAP